MAIKINWDRVRQLRDELTADGWKDSDKLLFMIVYRNGQPRKATIQFKELSKFCWDMSDDDKVQILTFIIQDIEGKVLYRHRQIVGNEEIPNGGNADIVAHWAALTEDEKATYIAMLVAQIDAYER